MATIETADVEQGQTIAQASAAQQRDSDSVLSVCDARFRVKGWKSEKTILNDVSFSVRGAEPLALMGPSGAGKTTLMEFMTMSLRGRGVQGQLLLNGDALTVEAYKRSVSYVEQFDTHWAFLTCKEVLEYAGALLVKGSAKEREANVEHMATSMGLQECSGTRCGNEFLKGLSGGQKKRLSIAVALLKDPTVLLLDEPTSGLDAASAISVMSYLKRLAHDERMIVVATIHQPATQIFMSFSNVLFLANGRTAYHGSPSMIEEHCLAIDRPLPPLTNPADHFIQLINSEFAGRESVDQVVAAWAPKPHSGMEAWRPDRQQSDRLARPGFASQFWVLLQRHALLALRDPTLYVGRVFAFAFCNSFFAVIYLRARDRTQEFVMPRVFLLNWMFGIVTMFSVIVVFTANIEYKMLRKEIKNGMASAGSYLLATSFLPLPFMLVLSASALLGPYYVIGNGNVMGMCQTLVVLAATLWGFESTAQCLATLVDNPLLGALGSLNFWTVSFLFSGFFLQPEFVIWPFRALNSIFPLGRTMTAMTYLEFHGSEWEGAVSTPDGGFVCPDGSPIQCYGPTGDDILRSLSNAFPVDDTDTVFADVMLILCYGLFWKLLQLAVVFVRARTAFNAPKPRQSPPSL